MKAIKIVRIVISCAFSALLLFSGGYKWGTMPYFYNNVVRNPISEGLVPYVAYGFPSLLLVLGILIVLDVFRLIGRTTPYLLGASTFIMAFLALYCHLIVIGYFDKPRPCSCSGILGMSWEEHTVFNSWFSANGVLAFLLYGLERYNSPLAGYIHKNRVKFAARLKKWQTPSLNS